MGSPLSGRLRLDAFRALSVPIWAALCALLAAVVVARARFDIPWRHLLGDPAAITGSPFYLGLVSNVGALLWAASASIFLFTFYVRRGVRREEEWGRFLLCSGLFVGVLGVDDFFMLHDQVFPNYLSIGQTWVVGAYGILAAAYLARFAAALARTAFPVLLLAMGFLALSAALDQLADHFAVAYFGKGFFEDAAKLLGIGTWLSYAVHTSAALLKPQSVARPELAFSWSALRSLRSLLPQSR